MNSNPGFARPHFLHNFCTKSEPHFLLRRLMCFCDLGSVARTAIHKSGFGKNFLGRRWLRENWPHAFRNAPLSPRRPHPHSLIEFFPLIRMICRRKTSTQRNSSLWQAKLYLESWPQGITLYQAFKLELISPHELIASQMKPLCGNFSLVGDAPEQFKL